MKSYLLLFLTILSVFTLKAQVTTSSLTGVVTHSTGQFTPGATIKATHVPSGSIYSGSSNSVGRFNIANMRVGGPYQIEVTHVGQQPILYEEVFLQLGQAYVLNPIFKDSFTEIKGIAVERKIRELKSGSSTIVNRRQIESLPTVSRSVNDITRLTPQANGTAIGGGTIDLTFLQ